LSYGQKFTTRKFACIPPSVGRSGEAQNAFKKDENLAMLRTLDKIRTYFKRNPDVIQMLSFSRAFGTDGGQKFLSPKTPFLFARRSRRAGENF
jgi:hypothetical protein